MSDALIYVAGPLAALLAVAAPGVAARKVEVPWRIYAPLVLTLLVAAYLTLGG